MRINGICPHCRERSEVDVAAGTLSVSCPRCGREFLTYVTDELRETGRLGQCPMCGSAHLYRQKDFNRAVGVGILAVGVALAYFTYGLSLLAVTLLDWLLYRRVGEVGCCYRCGTQFRGGGTIETLEPFDLVLHDYYRNLRGT